MTCRAAFLEIISTIYSHLSDHPLHLPATSQTRDYPSFKVWGATTRSEGPRSENQSHEISRARARSRITTYYI